MTNPVYDHKSITTLSPLEHLRQNAGMYVGDTVNPNHLVYECLDNSLDEASAKHASLIGVIINNKKNICTISDNGRGMPFQNNTIEKIFTMFSGGKFKKGQQDSSYGIASGLHGIGLTAVGALSEWVEVIVYRDNKRALFRLEDCKIVKEEINSFDCSKKPFSTQITFKPNKKYFESLVFDTKPIKDRMTLASVHIDHLQLLLMIDGKKEIINCTIDDYFKDVLFEGSTKNTTPIFDLRSKVKDEEVWIKFAWDLSSASPPKHTGCVNLLSVDQGTHINMTYNIFRNVFSAIAEKEKLKFLPQDCLVSFRCHTNLSLYTPEYTSQTKDKLSTSKAKLDFLYNNLEKQLISFLDKYPNIKLELLGFFDSYRKRLSASKNIVKGGKEVSRFNQIIDSKLKDCTNHTVINSELFITEGSSAAGSLVQCRDPRYHAILGLKGKIPNIAGSKKDFLKNKEITEIINCIGTGIEPDFTVESLRYGKVIFACDADADGAHITSLLMIVFLRLAPQLIKKSVIYRSIMPLYGAVIQKKFVPLYSDVELNKFKEKNPNIKIQRYKGLGEMNPDQLKVCLLDSTRKLEAIRYPTNSEEIFQLMISAELKRGLINEE